VLYQKSVALPSLILYAAVWSHHEIVAIHNHHPQWWQNLCMIHHIHCKYSGLSLEPHHPIILAVALYIPMFRKHSTKSIHFLIASARQISRYMQLQMSVCLCCAASLWSHSSISPSSFPFQINQVGLHVNPWQRAVKIQLVIFENDTQICLWHIMAFEIRSLLTKAVPMINWHVCVLLLRNKHILNK